MTVMTIKPHYTICFLVLVSAIFINCVQHYSEPEIQEGKVTKQVINRDQPIVVFKVTSLKDGEPVIGANICVKDIYDCLSTDLDGKASMTDFSPGIYNLRVWVIWSDTLFINDVEISSDDKIMIEVSLKPKEGLSLYDPIHLGKPVLGMDKETCTIRRLTAEEIERMAIDK